MTLQEMRAMRAMEVALGDELEAGERVVYIGEMSDMLYKEGTVLQSDVLGVAASVLFPSLLAPGKLLETVVQKKNVVRVWTMITS